ncbi:hypothetical protein LCGC14_0790920 [marine sediment metagenome]|uniref:Uncharacterized protein n=1 Tax=marine sediment metagenome TaxID=412755 RepID=A0A0F9PSN5_9ZZZZ
MTESKQRKERRTNRVLGTAEAIFHPVYHRECNPGFSEYFAGLLKARRYPCYTIGMALWCPSCALLGLWLLVRGKAVIV